MSRGKNRLRTPVSRRDICGVESAPSSPEPFAAPSRLWSLDVWRGLCASVVFLSHWFLWSDFQPHGAVESAVQAGLRSLHEWFTILVWPTGGHHPAVIAFFVLSGFCIHYPYERRARATGAAPDWREYFRRRFLRIAPVYWAACVAGLAFALAEDVAPSGSALLRLHATGTIGDFVVRFSGIAAIYPKEIFAGNYILITVTVEIAMYVIYPVFFRFAQRGAWVALGTIFLAAHLASVLLLPYVTAFWVFNSVFMLGLFWYAGALAAHLFLLGRGRISALAVLATWAGFLVLKHLPYFYGLNLLKQAAWAAVCAGAILWAIDWEKRHPAAGARPTIAALRWCGDISYSLYAMHTPAIMLATWALLSCGCTNYSVQLLATMGLAVGTVWVVHYRIERVFYRLRSEAGPALSSK